MKYLKLIVILLLFSAKLKAQTDAINIIQKPIEFNQERIDLSLDYMRTHYGIVQKTPTINPLMIVLHYTEVGTLEHNIRYFNNTYLNGRKNLSRESALNVSSQFIIDRDGSIYQLMPPTQFARHTIGLNYCAIGIENIGGSKQPLTEAQAEANAKLIRYLTKKYSIQYLIGHSEYSAFRNSSLWKEKNPNYFTEKYDPGASFMQKVRTKIQDLHLKSAP
ncbi:peptidoglycan recognition protein family protein [Elizabethkingia anophelis]|uniref:peptidoglycan recognition protein family protein n=1 Tax=Elizabethkingia anophelis TaxID=1117645 RepID=UPI00200E9640|nr:peptidoglycan recognition family protein [Elizabethkingia anophelis]MCL1033712.1 peptidoglycan recognition protein family protein [Elizabethkingia anophelis]MCW2463864.1 N-acetyl-anhydromuramyl-L-alanine amidase AmpD [Elizabethkingia anophelis]MCW2467548.1 N-acetyl-anhydromuramyl-L-alanine amidase AmpD [Elizabethkingia anophelis]MCW2470304.1 N-acetyl-anhydromuramyl-L-alanine amidase AmpD [Elizabethkingia anophelis]HBI9691956.1 N-acetylmuramoyl-L-alanine amidase [Elizabethkingia anophelis]